MPTLLEDIQAAAIDGNSDLAAVLRRCKVLAARLGSAPLEDWVLWESNGYPEQSSVPAYRIWPLQVKGTFFGPFGSGMQNVPIPLACIPDDVRRSYEAYECRQSIASLETAMKSGQTTFSVSTADLALALGTDVYENQNCVKAWAEFSAGHVVEILNTVRNRVLDFALAIWKEAPRAGELDENRLEPAHVTQIFYTTVGEGGVATVVGSALHSSIGQTIITNNISSLHEVLRRQGLTAADLEDLDRAIAADAKPVDRNRLGPTVSSWMGKMVKKAAEGSWKIGVSVASKVLTEALLKFYGFS